LIGIRIIIEGGRFVVCAILTVRTIALVADSLIAANLTGEDVVGGSR
jgi:hypothetical protein